MAKKEKDPISILEKFKVTKNPSPANAKKMYTEARQELGTALYTPDVFESYSNRIYGKTEFKPVLKEVGKMITFRYFPQTYKTLPYFDAQPLILIVEVPDKDTVIGVNLHYYSIQDRMRTFYSMWPLLTDRNLGEQARFRMYYRIISESKKYIRGLAGLKEYKTNRIRSRVYEINPKYWETALALPTEHFIKKKSHVIQTETSKKIRKLLGESNR